MPEKKVKHPDVIYLRSYPKVIFFWPLLLFSAVFWLTQALLSGRPGENPNEGNTILGYIWFIVFFINIFITAFDFSST
ncbi:MAG: hypothetical protein ACFFCI_19065, partial [Promethearchaeota archaeon]